MRGDGRVFLRSNSTYYWMAYWLHGVEYRESTKKSDETAALKVLKAKLKEVGAAQIGAQQFTTPKAQRLTVHDLIESLRQEYALRGKLSPQSSSHLDRVDKDFGLKRAIDLTSETIDSYIRERVEAGDAPSSINRTTQLLGQSYKLAIRRKHLNHAPAMTHLSEAGNERKGFFSREEFDRVYAKLPKDVADFALFGYLTGWRKGEIASLTWQDVEDGVIRLRGQNAKNGEARSVVIAGELSSLIERRKQSRVVKDVLVRFVFHREGLGVVGIRKSWASACVAAGLGRMICPKCNGEGTDKKCPDCEVRTVYVGRIFHDLRRTAVRNMVRSGVPQNVATKISGHKTDSMFRRYDIANEQDLRMAMESLERYKEPNTDRTRTISQK